MAGHSPFARINTVCEREMARQSPNDTTIRTLILQSEMEMATMDTEITTLLYDIDSWRSMSMV
jgi:hypothetical protein